MSALSGGIPSVLFPRSVRAWVLALVLTGIAFLVTWGFWSLTDQRLALFLLVAVMVVTWYAGLGPGIVSAAGGTLLDKFFLASPQYGLSFASDELARAAVVIAASLFVGVLALVRVETERRLKASLDDLAATIRQLQETRAALESKDEFVGFVAHELKSPLTVVAGVAQILSRRGESLGREERTELTRDMAAEVERLESLVMNLLALARTEQGVEMETEPVQIQHVVNKQVEALRRIKPLRNVTVDVGPALRPVRAAPIPVEQVLRNILGNADKYSPPHDPIEVSVKSVDSTVCVSVRDHGPGVPQEDLDHLFERFYRTDSAVKAAGGMGLGLAVSKRLIEAQGGGIWVDRPSDGGLAVSFSLPVYTDDEPLLQPRLA
jgi:K+-sensing histidine kinase KdpD